MALDPALHLSGANSKATTANPKDLLGSKKVPLGEVCPVAMLHEACAMLDGDIKYGFRNWREKNVVARIYIDAALRHLNSWAEGEEYAEDSGVHHLGHARACLGILLDAQETGNLIDNRAPGVFSKVADRLSTWVKERVAKGVVAQPAVVIKSPMLRSYENFSDLFGKCPQDGAVCEECGKTWGKHCGTRCDSNPTDRRWTVKTTVNLTDSEGGGDR